MKLSEAFDMQLRNKIREYSILDDPKTGPIIIITYPNFEIQEFTLEEE